MKLPVVRPQSKAGLNKKAEKYLAQLQPGVLTNDSEVDVESFFEFHIPELFGIKTGYSDLSSEFGLYKSVLGYTNCKEKISYIDKSLSNAFDPTTTGRFRATVAHEIGHCILHVPFLNFESSSQGASKDMLFRKTTHIKAYENPEWQAWEFAGALLMPKNRVIRYAISGLPLHQMAQTFGVNPAFVKVRLSKLKREIPHEMAVSYGI
jgi:hypothetical protein